MSGSGGGSSGKIDFPQYMKDLHEPYMDELKDIVDTQVGGTNPFTLAQSYDVTEEVESSQTRYDDHDALVEDLDAETEFKDYISTAESEVDDHLETSDADITTAVTAFETAQAPVLARSLNRFTGPMAGANAVGGSAFVVGVALIEAQHNSSVDSYRAVIQSAADTERRAAIMAALKYMMDYNIGKVDSDRLSTVTQAEINRIKMVAKKEQYEDDIGYDVEDAMWDIRLYEPLFNGLGSIHSAAYMPKQTKRGIGSAIGGAMGGAVMGAIVMPGMPLLGAAIGGGLGLAASL
ncbi:hypothetical protein LCGC14_1236130 [marine sediment metagenome]|uniref:Uncharacterized protein n=1 Tax=marine sediment metagenome TaxID=412755 RepID=A0A0F9LBA5_9ZZZZ